MVDVHDHPCTIPLYSPIYRVYSVVHGALHTITIPRTFVVRGQLPDTKAGSDSARRNDLDGQEVRARWVAHAGPRRSRVLPCGRGRGARDQAARVFRPAAIEASVPSAAAAVSTWPAAAASNALQGPACPPWAQFVAIEVYTWLLNNGWHAWDAHRAAVAAWQASVMVPCGDVQRVRAIAWAAAWGVLGSPATSWHFQ